MSYEIRINNQKHTIEITKQFSKAAQYYGTKEYETLQKARRDYPNYHVEVKTSAKKADCFKGLTTDYMESYIKSRIEKSEDDPEAKKEYESILTDFFLLCGKDENGEKKKIAEIASYGELKMWFLAKFPELNISRSKIDEILKSVKKSA